MELQQIKLSEMIRSHLSPTANRLLPEPLLKGLESYIRQERLNEVLSLSHPRQGSEFCQWVIDYLNIDLEVRGLENIPEQGRFIFASNHPLGGLDGMTLISILGQKYGDENIRFLVNDLLMGVAPLRNVFLPINKYGAQGREAARAINETYDSAKQILIFPAGLVSRLQQGEVRDLQWQKAFIVKAIQSERDIIPVHFEAENSRRFYKMAQWRKRLHIKVNLEQSLLPSEVFKAEGKRFRITFGRPISHLKLKQSEDKPLELAEAVKHIVYSL